MITRELNDGLLFSARESIITLNAKEETHFCFILFDAQIRGGFYIPPQDSFCKAAKTKHGLWHETDG